MPDMTFFSVYKVNIKSSYPGSTDLLKREAINVARSFIPRSRCDFDKTIEETFMQLNHMEAVELEYLDFFSNHDAY